MLQAEVAGDTKVAEQTYNELVIIEQSLVKLIHGKLKPTDRKAKKVPTLVSIKPLHNGSRARQEHEVMSQRTKVNRA